MGKTWNSTGEPPEAEINPGDKPDSPLGGEQNWEPSKNKFVIIDTSGRKCSLVKGCLWDSNAWNPSMSCSILPARCQFFYCQAPYIE